MYNDFLCPAVNMARGYIVCHVRPSVCSSVTPCVYVLYVVPITGIHYTQVLATWGPKICMEDIPLPKSLICSMTDGQVHSRLVLYSCC